MREVRYMSAHHVWARWAYMLSCPQLCRFGSTHSTFMSLHPPSCNANFPHLFPVQHRFSSDCISVGIQLSCVHGLSSTLPRTCEARSAHAVGVPSGVSLLPTAVAPVNGSCSRGRARASECIAGVPCGRVLTCTRAYRLLNSCTAAFY